MLAFGTAQLGYIRCAASAELREYKISSEGLVRTDV